MSTNARFRTGADVLAGWRESLLSGTGPTLYPVGTGMLGQVEIGPGRVVLVGGLPGGGKTALCTQLAIDAVRSTPSMRAVIANVEMTPEVLLDRQLARVSGVPLDAITHRKLTAEHADRIDRGLATLDSFAERVAFVGPPYDLGNIAATADDFGGELLLLDYLQRIRPPGSHADKRGSVDSLMDFIRQFADAGSAVLCVSAVARSKDNRGRSTYEGDVLSLASFRESSELEYGADTAYVLVPARLNGESVTLRCLKHRHGEPISVSLRFERGLQRFTPTESTGTETDTGAALTALAELWNKTQPAGEESASS